MCDLRLEYIRSTVSITLHVQTYL